MKFSQKVIILIFYLFLLFAFIFYEISEYSTNNSNKHKYIETNSYQPNNFSFNTECDPKILNLNVNCIKFLVDLSKKEAQKNDCRQCFLRRPDNSTFYVYYHTFWNIKSNQTVSDYQFRVLKLNLISYLATQNLCCTRFILWKLDRFPLVKIENLWGEFSVYLKNNSIQIKTLDIKELCLTTLSFKNHNLCRSDLSDLSHFGNMVGLSDFVRFFVLDQYGGIYTDGDVIYLKNMQIFWYFNFAYRWSFLNDKINTAVMGINKNFEPSVNKLYDLVIQRSTQFRTLVQNFHPHTLSLYMYELNDKSIFNWKSLQVLHSYLFDPSWLCNDGFVKRVNETAVCRFDEFTRKEFISDERKFQFEQFYPGAYTYHLHLENAGPYISNNSYFSHFERYFRHIV